MNNKFEIQDILIAVDEILNNKKTTIKKNFNYQESKMLILSDEVRTKKNKDDIPSDTEKIILEAEKFLKK
tara:strand:+ start:1103 stop:1312 length:210 start_codon:yes stop_codon:yes gene_type:complete